MEYYHFINRIEDLEKRLSDFKRLVIAKGGVLPPKKEEPVSISEPPKKEEPIPEPTKETEKKEENDPTRCEGMTRSGTRCTQPKTKKTDANTNPKLCTQHNTNPPLKMWSSDLVQETKTTDTKKNRKKPDTKNEPEKEVVPEKIEEPVAVEEPIEKIVEANLDSDGDLVDSEGIIYCPKSQTPVGKKDLVTGKKTLF